MSDDDLPEDPLPKLRADLDQFAASAPELARAWRAAHQAFVAVGFSESQALYLTASQFLGGPGTPP